jgi:hypothetical protein
MDAALALPTGLAVVAGDNDHKTVCRRHKDEGRTVAPEPRADDPAWCKCNPGLRAAQAAAIAVSCGVCWPTDIDGTDWSDWRAAQLLLRLQQRRPHERDSEIRRAVDAAIQMQMQKHARFVVKQ